MAEDPKAIAVGEKWHLDFSFFFLGGGGGDRRKWWFATYGMFCSYSKA